MSVDVTKENACRHRTHDHIGKYTPGVGPLALGYKKQHNGSAVNGKPDKPNIIKCDRVHFKKKLVLLAFGSYLLKVD